MKTHLITISVIIIIGLFIASVCIFPQITGKICLGIFVIFFAVIIYILIYGTVDEIINNKDDGDIWY